MRFIRALFLFGSPARALSDDTLTMMPDGRWYEEDCIHRLDEEHEIESGPEGDLLRNLRTGEVKSLPPCPRATRQQYYSSWIIDAVTVHEEITYMSSNWTVPKAPSSSGPVPGMSSAYLFNGLEDGGGVHGKATGILQPVLSHGKSGCVLNPWSGWVFTAFQVTGAGRAYCGSNIAVKEGDELFGAMELLADGSWKITADAGPRGRSVHTMKSSQFRTNAAYLTLEGMIIYKCSALPGGAVTFSGNKLLGPDGRQLQPKWRGEVRHPECKPAAEVMAGSDVKLSWTLEDQLLV